MKTKISSVCLFLSFGFNLSAQAGPQEVKNYVWNDQKGLVDASLCEMITSNDSHFFVTASPENKNSVPFINKNNKSGTIPVKSLFASADRASMQQYMPLKLVYQPTATAAVNAQGLVPTRNIHPIDDYVIAYQGKTSSGPVNLQNMFLQTTLVDGKVIQLACGKGSTAKKYTLFDVFTKDSIHLQARIGVHANEAGIFKNVAIYDADEAERIFGDEADKGLPLENDSETNIAKINVPHGQSLRMNKGVLEKMAAILQPTPIHSQSGPSTKNSLNLIDISNSLQASQEMTDLTAPPTTTTPSTVTNPAEAGEEEGEEADQGTQTTQSSLLQYMVCTQSGDVLVRDQSLQSILTRAKQFESVTPMQTWEAPQSDTHMLVMLPDQKNSEGWVAKEFIRLASDCVPYQEAQKIKSEMSPISVSKGGAVTSPECCVFPTHQRPTSSYKKGMRKFGAGRSRGRRLHAACDLYRKHGDPAIAITQGKVIRDHYFFYQGTYAIELVHEGGQVARYGELTRRKAKSIQKDTLVNPGQTIGYIGTVNSGCCEPMLHFELYSVKVKGSLGRPGTRGFQRRSDLMNPTEYLSRWEKKQFGISY